jgi:hypothetical protein
MTQVPDQPGVFDVDEYAREDQEDIGEPMDLDGDGIPDELDAGDLDDLLGDIDPDDVPVITEDEEVDDGGQ